MNQSLHKETKTYKSAASNYGRKTPGYKEDAIKRSKERLDRLKKERNEFYKLIVG